jgi:hypothetical protein
VSTSQGERAVQQRDGADEVRAGNEPRPSQLISVLGTYPSVNDERRADCSDRGPRRRAMGP